MGISWDIYIYIIDLYNRNDIYSMYDRFDVNNSSRPVDLRVQTKHVKSVHIIQYSLLNPSFLSFFHIYLFVSTVCYYIVMAID